MGNETGVAGPQMSQLTSVVNFLNWAFRLVREHEKQNVLCLLPEHLETYPKAVVRSLHALDNLGTDPYWFLSGERWDECVPRLSRHLDSRVQSTIGSGSEITQAVVAVAQLEADVVAIWGFDPCAAMSAIACERPQVTWKSFLRGIELVRNQT